MASTLAVHTASGQALGYFFQLERALSWLAKAPPDSLVGIETEDDVVVKLLAGQSILEQDKSSTGGHPFLAGRPDLWKTLLIWAEAIESKEIDVTSTYFFLVTNKDQKESDSLAAILSKAKTEDEVKSALAVLRDKGTKITGEVRKLIDKLFKYPETVLCPLIKHLSYRSGSTVAGEAIKLKLQGDLQLDMATPDQNLSIMRELTGWVFDQVVSAWRDKRPAYIDRNSFHRMKINIITGYRQQVVNEMVIALGEIPAHVSRAEWKNHYVKQLELIGLTKDEIFTAIHDYLNSVSKRTLLAKNGYLTQPELMALDENLEKHWLNIFKSRKISYKHLEPSEIGQIIFLDVTCYDTTVGKYVLKSHFITRGSYHALADKLKVGWHPEYKVLFKLNVTSIPLPKKNKKDA